MKWLYLALAIAGAILPWLSNLAFIREYGASFDLGLFVQLANANPAASSLSRDLAIGATAVVIWMVQESRRLQMRGLAWVLFSCVTLAFACGAPLFLYLRERRLEGACPPLKSANAKAMVPLDLFLRCSVVLYHLHIDSDVADIQLINR
ncbi:DUF2834 domain-containing protein [Cyanobium sp. ATX-6F1]|uniref:DUF2834 domain-containing protein n=1 Tax=Cyanobium sp. ATX-6F1 TaxID=3137388 RepID=UPI0039BE9305